MGVNYACSVTYACGCSSVEQRKPVPPAQSQGVAPLEAGGTRHEHVGEDAAYKGLFDSPLDMLPMPCLLAKKEAPAPLPLLPDVLPRPPELPQSPQATLLGEPHAQILAENEERRGPPSLSETQVLPRALSDVTNPSPSARLRSLEGELMNPLLPAEENAALHAEVIALRRQIASAQGQTGVPVTARQREPQHIQESSWLDSLTSGCAAMSISHPASRVSFGDMFAMPDDACTQPQLQEPDHVIHHEDASWQRCRREQLANEYRLLPDVCRSEVETAVGASLIGPHLMPNTLVPERTW